MILVERPLENVSIGDQLENVSIGDQIGDMLVIGTVIFYSMSQFTSINVPCVLL